MNPETNDKPTFGPLIIDTCSVKVMRSHNYCHFEVILGSNLYIDPVGDQVAITDQQVDDLRKRAARLADKAVEQYKIARRAEELRESNDRERSYMNARALAIEANPESERTPEEQAIIKKASDDAYWARRGHYDYEDDYREDDDDC